MSKDADDEVSQLLHSWGLSDLKAKFKANYIILQAFEYLTEDDIIELIPKIGQRAIFRGRLLQWRQQNGIPPSSPLKMCKLEPLSDKKTKQRTDTDDLKNAPPEPEPDPEPQAQLQPELPLEIQPELQPEPQLEPQPQQSPDKSPSKMKHKVYGTLTKCTQPPKNVVARISKSAIQSKVKQFYISPIADIMSHPVDPKPDLTPFVTSIIRVETNCDKTYIKSENPNDTPSKPQTKVNRTTILQRLTKCDSKRARSPNISTKNNLAEDTQVAEERKKDQHPEKVPSISSHLYPIIKLETGLNETNWNEYSEPEPVPQQESAEPEHESVDLDETVEREQKKDIIGSVAFQNEYIESMESDSGPEFDSENESTFQLKRMAPEVFRRRRKRTRILGKLDIRNILMNSDMGRHVLNYYETNERLDMGRRRMLIDAIVQDCWLSNRRISPTDCSEIAEEIIEILPNERIEDYFIAQTGKNPKSPLYNKYRNMHRRFFIDKGLPIPIHKKKKPRLSLETDDIEIDDNIIIS